MPDYEESNRTCIVFERRGKREDNELELEFRRICDGANWSKRPLPFSIKFADKRVNSTGLQLADMVARPVGLHVLKLQQQNRAFDVPKHKFFCKGGRENTGKDYEELGLTQAKMAALFATSTDNVNPHLKNTYSENELTEKATTEKYSVVHEHH